MKIFVITGEASGDLLASKIITELRKTNKKLNLKGVGGAKLKQHKITNIFAQEKINIMGFVEVVPAIPRILKLINKTVLEIQKYKPDFIITVDAPDFNFRVVRKLRNLGYDHSKIIHVVAPTVWAYREYRAARIAKLYDQLLVLFPFEPPYFEKYGLNTKFIGHPIIFDKVPLPKEDYIKKHKIEGRQILVLTLGSRKKEIKILAPIYKEVIEQLAIKGIKPIIVIPSFKKYLPLIQKSFKKAIITTSEKEKLYFFDKATAVIAKSGTNTFEIAKAHAPFVVCYKVNQLTYMMLKRIVKTKFVNLINILAKREIVSEFIQEACEPTNITAKISELLSDDKLRQDQINKQDKYLSQFLNKNQDPSKLAAKEILKLLKN